MEIFFLINRIKNKNMDRLKKLSRDEIRSEVSKLNANLKLLKNEEIKKLKKQEMIDIILKHQFEAPQSSNINSNKGITSKKIEQIILNEIFPFEESIFSDYDEFRGITRITTYENESNIINFEEYMEKFDKRSVDYFVKIVKKQTLKFLHKKETNVINDLMNTNIKIRFSVEFEMSKLDCDTEKFYANTTTKTLLISDDRSKFYRNECRELLDKIEILECKGSGWHVERITKLFMMQAKYEQFRPGSYLKLPNG